MSGEPALIWQATAAWPVAAIAIDGARFADPQRQLAPLGIDARPLLRPTPRRPVPRSGPFMVAADRAAMDRLAQLPGLASAAVFWTGAPTPDAAHDHMRRINEAIIPARDGPGSERVLFRHWDPEVLALIVPVLTPVQKQQLFGPMQRLALFSQDAGRVLATEAGPPVPAAPRGPIQFAPGQMVVVEQAMRARSDRTIMRYLRRNAPQPAQGMDDAAMLRHVGESRAGAATFGARSEAGVGRYAWLQLATGGRFSTMPEVRSLFAQRGGVSGDAVLKELMRSMVRQLQGR